MRVETREVQRVIQKQIFIADDGTEFYSQYECEEYEFRKRKENARKAIEDIEQKIFTPPLVDDDRTWKWYLVKNHDDLERVCRYYENIDSGNNLNPTDFNVKAYPEWICVVETCYGDCYSAGTFKGYRSAVNKLFDTLNISKN